MCHNFAGAGGALTRGQVRPRPRGRRRPDTCTPPWSPARSRCRSSTTRNLTPEAKQKVISYLKAQEQATNVGGLSLGNLGPVSEGLFAWVFVLGILIAAAVWLGKKAA